MLIFFTLIALKFVVSILLTIDDIEKIPVFVAEVVLNSFIRVQFTNVEISLFCVVITFIFITN